MERADLEEWKAREVARLLALVETERRYYQEIVASIPVGLLVLSTDLAIISANRAIRKIFGLRGGDPLRGRLDAILPGWLLDRVLEVLKTGTPQTNIMVELDGEVKRRLRIGILAIRNWDDEAAEEALLSIEDLTGVAVAPAVPEAAPVLEVEPQAEPEPASTSEAAAAPEPLVESVPVVEPEPIAWEEPIVEPEAPPEEPEPEPYWVSPAELIDNVDAVVWVLELPSKVFRFVSPHADQLLGYPREHWTGSADFWTERIHAADRVWVAQAYDDAIRRGESLACEFRAAAAQGRIVWLRETARVLKDSQGEPNMVIGVTVDVSERRQLEDQLVQSERVEAISRLASRMAHDLNNMLMILTGYSEELLNEIPAGSPVRADVQEILNATERMSGLTSQLLAFSRRQGNAPSPVNLEPLLAARVPQFRAMAGDNINIEMRFSSERTAVKADPAQLEQAVTTILERGLQSMRGEGRITLGTSSTRIHEDLRRAEAPLRPGSYGVITLSFSGRPLEGDAYTSLFESVLSGRDAQEEAAAAVSRAYGIVRQWGGDISVSNRPEGVVFQVFLQGAETIAERHEEPAPVEPEVVPQAEEEEVRLETILVVEDEAGIRALVRKILHRQGYFVLEAGNGEEALALSKSHPGNIDLLITDMVMPHMGGRELADRLHEQRENLKVLYVSGYTDDASVYAGNFPPGTAFLQKPFTLGSLLDKVKEVLSAA